LTLAHALALMRAAHADRFDLGGAPYWTHPMRVMEGLGPDATDEAKIVALLHDTVEDAGVTLDDLRRWFGPAVADAVELLTRPEGMTYAAYIDRLAASGNATAIRVKLADLADNLDPTRPHRTARLTERYLKARDILAARL
jgi:(p)ppGpp synthase/HD superfamily hydrolase